MNFEEYTSIIIYLTACYIGMLYIYIFKIRIDFIIATKQQNPIYNLYIYIV